MCTFSQPSPTQFLLARMKAKGGKMRLWRVVRVGEDRLESPAQPIFHHYQWHPGINVSSARRKHPYKQAKRIAHGFHCIVNRADSHSALVEVYQTYCDGPYAIIPITCDAADLIGASRTTIMEPTPRIAVFRKVHLSKRAYNRALKEGQQ